ncbi:signal peptidase [Sphingobacterium alkalisoli]|uniref:Signal peptidase n=1 Tax=Sphingobacterium alkalisoli TaxID=1874115 RepID=A0A4U0H7U2_9SPHI|nr:signal peptidase [Sphingobacterium alkalisoli]TJY67756.1 signal peptidase [Sphingobacterium alkalisoli]
MNKYLFRGILLLLTGIAAVYGGNILMESENSTYKISMVIGVILFGMGFLLIIYSFFRKIDRKTILDRRREKQ